MFLRGERPLVRRSMPINIREKPIRISPTKLTFLFFDIRLINILIIKGIKPYFPTLKAIICDVMVVPIFAPIIIGVAWYRVSKLVSTSPTKITVVALLDCRIPVTIKPIKIPNIG